MSLNFLWKKAKLSGLRSRRFRFDMRTCECKRQRDGAKRNRAERLHGTHGLLHVSQNKNCDVTRTNDIMRKSKKGE